MALMRIIRTLLCLDELIAVLALGLMVLIPVLEVLLRPLSGAGVQNAPVVVQHLGLVMAMFGALAAERHGHLATFGSTLRFGGRNAMSALGASFGKLLASLICGVLTMASWRLVSTEMGVAHALAYGVPVWWIQFAMPAGFLLLGVKLASRAWAGPVSKLVSAVACPAIGIYLAYAFDGASVSIWPICGLLLAGLVLGTPIFAVLGGLALALFWQDGLPLASVALSHYQITVNPSLPALPLFTLAGLIFARTQAASRLSAVFVALFGGSSTGTVIASAVLCSAFTAFTGGSGVTILALGGLLLPLLKTSGFPEKRAIGLVTSASALGVLLAPSVPLIMYAVIARVPINTMFLAGILPAFVMVLLLLFVGGYLRAGNTALESDDAVTPAGPAVKPAVRTALLAAWRAKWELMAPVVAIGALVSGLSTPTESAAITAVYAIVSQAWAHRELGWKKLTSCMGECVQIIGGVMLILGMALGLTNFIVEAGLPDQAILWIHEAIPNKFVFLLALNVFLFFAGALMEIFAAIVVLVPLLLPVAISYGIDPVHFGIIFLASMEMGFLCPPAGMNIYFASAMFGKPIRYVAAAVLPALAAIFVGTLVISWIPQITLLLPSLMLGH